MRRESYQLVLKRLITDIGCLCEGKKKDTYKHFDNPCILKVTLWIQTFCCPLICFATSFRADQAFLWQGHKPDIKSNIFVARTLWSFSFSWCISSLAMLQIRMQAEYQSVVNVRRKGMLQSFASIFKEEGIRGLYRVIFKILFNFCSGN